MNELNLDNKTQKALDFLRRKGLVQGFSVKIEPIVKKSPPKHSIGDFDLLAGLWNIEP